MQKPIIKIYNKDNINFFSLLQNHSYIYIKGNKNKEYTESSLNSAAISRKCVSDHEISVQFAHRPLFRAKKFVSIIHGVSSFEYFILEVIAISIFSLSLSRFFTDFRSPNIVHPGDRLGEIYHGVKIHLSLWFINRCRVIVLPSQGASRYHFAFNSFFDTFYLFFFATLHFLRDNKKSFRIFRTFPYVIFRHLVLVFYRGQVKQNRDCFTISRKFSSILNFVYRNTSEKRNIRYSV